MTRARILADYVAGGTTAAEFDHIHGLTSTAVGINDTQTLANKTLASTTTFPDAHSFKLYVASDYTFGTQTTSTKILLDTAISNSFGANTSNNSFTPTVTGRYFLKAQVDMHSKNNEMMWAYIYNGSTVIGHKTGWLDNGGTATAPIWSGVNNILEPTLGVRVYKYKTEKNYTQLCYQRQCSYRRTAW